MTNATDTFNAHADSYDAARRRLVPPFDSFYATAVAALRLTDPCDRILDLGAGTGLLSSHVRRALPRARLTLLDGAPAMLAHARKRLGETNVEYLVADLEDPLPRPPWDAIISALAIHHLSDESKRALFARIKDALRVGGVFVNAEQVEAPTPRFSALYARWHEHHARTAGSDPAEWAGAVARMRHDRPATVEHQLAWLGDAGFADVDCLFKDHRFAVMVAIR